MPRWAAICGDCWQEEFPTEYFPDSIEFETCDNCGQDALCAHVNATRLADREDPKSLFVDETGMLPEEE